MSPATPREADLIFLNWDVMFLQQNYFQITPVGALQSNHVVVIVYLHSLTPFNLSSRAWHPFPH